MGIGGALLLNLSYAAALYAAVYAYGGDLAYATVGFVYLAAGAVGSAAPTPGGIGAVEAALAWMAEGPPGARVSGLLVSDEAPTGDAGFSVI